MGSNSLVPHSTTKAQGPVVTLCRTLESTIYVIVTLFTLQVQLEQVILFTSALPMGFLPDPHPPKFIVV